MQPQGSTVYNTAYLENITSQINHLAHDVNSVNPCQEIQRVVDEAMRELQAEIDAIEAQIGTLKIMVTLPTNLAGVIKWIANFMGPSNKALIAYIKQMIQMISAIAQLMAAIERAAANLANCQISIAAPVVSLPLPTVDVIVPKSGPTGSSSSGGVPLR